MPEILDIPSAIKQAGGNPELAKELFGMLLNELPGLRTQLNQAFENTDKQPLRDTAHKIHGATAYCGVPVLQQAAGELETAIKEQHQDLVAKIQAVNTAIDELLQYGETMLQRVW